MNTARFKYLLITLLCYLVTMYVLTRLHIGQGTIDTVAVVGFVILIFSTCSPRAAVVLYSNHLLKNVLNKEENAEEYNFVKAKRTATFVDMLFSLAVGLLLLTKLL